MSYSLRLTLYFFFLSIPHLFFTSMISLILIYFSYMLSFCMFLSMLVCIFKRVFNQLCQFPCFQPAFHLLYILSFKVVFIIYLFFFYEMLSALLLCTNLFQFYGIFANVITSIKSIFSGTSFSILVIFFENWICLFFYSFKP